MDVYGHLFPRGDDTKELAEAESALLACVRHKRDIKAKNLMISMLERGLNPRVGGSIPPLGTSIYFI